MSRLNPFEFVFGGVADELFPVILREVGERPARSAFAGASTVQQLLPNMGETDQPLDPSVVDGYLRLLWIAHRYWVGGKPVVPVDRAALERLFDEPALPDFVGPAADAVYLELPPRWFWAQISEESPHEPLDGVFLVTGEHEPLSALAVLGLRPDRPGFSQFTATATSDDFRAAAGCVRRPLFAPTVVGGAEAGVRSITSEAELLHLIHLALHSARE